MTHVAQVALALIRADICVVQVGARAVLAAGKGVESSVSARELARPVVALEQGYLAQISVPIWQAGGMVGSVAVLGRALRAFEDAEVQLLCELAARFDEDDSEPLFSLH